MDLGTNLIIATLTKAGIPSNLLYKKPEMIKRWVIYAIYFQANIYYIFEKIIFFLKAQIKFNDSLQKKSIIVIVSAIIL